LLRQIVLGVLVNTIVALPMWILVRRSLIGSLLRSPPSPSPRVHDRRAEPLSRP